MAKNCKKKKIIDERTLLFLFNFERKINRYFPTKLAIELASGLSASNFHDQQRSDDIQSGFLIVETNYRVYAYTSEWKISHISHLSHSQLDNDLYLKITALFCKMLYR